MAVAATPADSRYTVAFTWRSVIQALIIGASVGLVVWVATILLRNYVFTPLLCHRSTGLSCGSAPVYAAAFAQIVAALAALFALVRVMAYRPLLGVLAATVTLWNVIVPITTSWTWYYGLVACILLYALAYGLYMLLARIRSMIVATVVMVILLVVIRLVLNS